MHKSNTIDLVDNHGRKINYLRLGLTDKCNLRCVYCMPENGMRFAKEEDLLSWEENLQIVEIARSLGINKIRLTGGEPFVRVGIMDFIQKISQFQDLEICITTNAILALPYLDELKQLGVSHLNISLDSLNKDNFKKITRRDEFDSTLFAIQEMIGRGFNLKMNVVMMAGVNDHEIPNFIQFAEKYPVEVRFIEEMPFNGQGSFNSPHNLSEKEIFNLINQEVKGLIPFELNHGDTAINYQLSHWKGKIGIIAAYSRSFCGACNRLRITPTGMIKNCLYDSGVFNLKKFIREGAKFGEIQQKIREIVGNRFINGKEAEMNREFKLRESMTTIGG